MPDSSGPGSVTLLGFDPGERHIGVAVGETLLGTAQPLEVLAAQHGEPEWSKVKALIDMWQPERLIVGVPYHADGSESRSTTAATRLANRLQGRFTLPVETVDERLSSYEAEQRLTTRDRRHDPLKVHSEAAAVILETYLAQGWHD